MFRWYQKASRCYVYLADVLYYQNRAELDWRSAFRSSRWFSRGWTLQELLAPKIVDFYSRDRIRIGDKHSLGYQIMTITGIPADALGTSDLTKFEVDERFAWVANRQTTRNEDIAYCLLGIFDVYMPLIYGEGAAIAQRRLRREIQEKEPAPLLGLRDGPKSTGGGAASLISPRKEAYVAVIGQSGSGKSSFVRALTGGDVRINHGLYSCMFSRMTPSSFG